jgi:hypothetical protein
MTQGPTVAGSIPRPGTLSPEQEAYIKEQGGKFKRQRNRTWRGKIGKIGPSLTVDVPKGASGHWSPPSDYLLAAGYYDPKKPLTSLRGFKVPLKTKQKLMGKPMTKAEFRKESAKDWATDHAMAWENDPMKSQMEPTVNKVISDHVPSVLHLNDRYPNESWHRAMDSSMRKLRRGRNSLL